VLRKRVVDLAFAFCRPKTEDVLAVAHHLAEKAGAPREDRHVVVLIGIFHDQLRGVAEDEIPITVIAQHNPCEIPSTLTLDVRLFAEEVA
jgi:hypothetical protein